MARRIKAPLTIRITAGEILESQLETDDLRALEANGGGEGGGSGGPVLCPGTYCTGGYSSVPPPPEVVAES